MDSTNWQYDAWQRDQVLPQCWDKLRAKSPWTSYMGRIGFILAGDMRDIPPCEVTSVSWGNRVTHAKEHKEERFPGGGTLSSCWASYQSSWYPFWIC